MKKKSKIFENREASNSNPMARKLSSRQFKPRLIKDKRKEQDREEARSVPDEEDW